MSYVLKHTSCNECIWSENGFYNNICTHCPYVTYSKNDEPSFMTREMAESLGLVKKNGNTDDKYYPCEGCIHDVTQEDNCEGQCEVEE